jgi:hypothetical protein
MRLDGARLRHGRCAEPFTELFALERDDRDWPHASRKPSARRSALRARTEAERGIGKKPSVVRR